MDESTSAKTSAAPGQKDWCRLRNGLASCTRAATRSSRSRTTARSARMSSLCGATWFLAIHLISQAKTGMSALALKRNLGVSYPTAWLLLQKINRAMADREAAHLLDGAVQLDDAHTDGEHSGG